MKRNLVLGVILLVGVSILLIGGSGAIFNQRVNPQVAIDQQNVNFTSKLKTMPTTNLETSSTAFTELSHDEISPAIDSTSPAVKTGDSITVNYVGWLAKDGTVFDQSFNHGDTGFTFTVGQGVIQGWSDGVVGMQAGEIRRLKIPASLGYGSSAVSTIPANSDLMFDVELISIN